jgi:hypothetical protein
MKYNPIFIKAWARLQPNLSNPTPMEEVPFKKPNSATSWEVNQNLKNSFNFEFTQIFILKELKDQSTNYAYSI